MEQLLWFVAALQPAAAVVFVLDGVLIGAGDAGYLAIAMLVATFAVYLPFALVVVALDAGLLWLWAAISLWMVARLVGMVARYRTDRWQVTGATRMTIVARCEQQVARLRRRVGRGAERSRPASCSPGANGREPGIPARSERRIS